MGSKELDQVREIIEKSTSKVSLRDLEKKGFRKVKVLRSNDIDQMIRKAVAQALDGGVDDRDELIRRSKAELKEQMSAVNRAGAELSRFQATNKALEKENSSLKSQLNGQGGLHGKLKELQRRLADSSEALGRAEATLQVREVEAARVEGVQQRALQLERENEALRNRTQDAELNARAVEQRAAQAEQQSAKADVLREQVESLTGRLKQLDMEKRLIEDLEVPRLRQQIEELTSALQTSREKSAGVEATPEAMRGMFRELLKEMGATKGDDVAQQLKSLQQSIASAVGGGGSGTVSEAEERAMKVSLSALFAHENEAVETNIGNVEVEESTGEGVRSSLNKLRSLRKKKG